MTHGNKNIPQNVDETDRFLTAFRKKHKLPEALIRDCVWSNRISLLRLLYIAELDEERAETAIKESFPARKTFTITIKDEDGKAGLGSSRKETFAEMRDIVADIKKAFRKNPKALEAFIKACYSTQSNQELLRSLLA